MCTTSARAACQQSTINETSALFIGTSINRGSYTVIICHSIVFIDTWGHIRLRDCSVITASCCCRRSQKEPNAITAAAAAADRFKVRQHTVGQSNEYLNAARIRERWHVDNCSCRPVKFQLVAMELKLHPVHHTRPLSVQKHLGNAHRWTF